MSSIPRVREPFLQPGGALQQEGQEPPVQQRGERRYFRRHLQRGQHKTVNWTWLCRWKDITSTKKNIFLMSLRIVVQHLVWLQSWRSPLSTEHQLIRDFHHPVPHLELGKGCTLPGSYSHCVRSYLTPNPLLPGRAPICTIICSETAGWFSDAFSMQKALPFCLFTPIGFNQVAEELRTFRAKPLLSFDNTCASFGSFVLCTHTSVVVLWSHWCCSSDLQLT